MRIFTAPRALVEVTTGVCYVTTLDFAVLQSFVTVSSPAGISCVPTPDAPQIRRELDRILTSPEFRSAGRRSRLLQYLVEKAIAGEQITEYAIGLDVFDKPAEYDPRIDPVVRVEMGRVRSRLADYYAAAGRTSPLRIEIPKRSHVPIFLAAPQGTAPEPAPRPPRARSRMIAGASLAVIALALVAFLIARQWISSRNHLNSVVVLPFQNLTGDPQKEYLADGITEQLTDSLAHVPDLRVVARTSAFQFKGKGMDVRQIGQRLDADAVVEGSLRSMNGRLLLTVQVNRSGDGYHIVSQTFEGAPQDLEKLESDSVSPVLAALRPGALPAKRKTVDPEAYDLFLKARARRAEGTEDAFDQAVIYLNQAIRRDPTYADAYAALAGAYAAAAVNFAAQPLDYAEKARAAAAAALQLDPRSAPAYAAQGLMDGTVFLEWRRGERELRKAIALMPQNPAAHNRLSTVLLAQGRFQEAVAEARIAAKLDPLSAGGVAVGLAYYMARQYDSALIEFTKARDLHPEVIAVHLFIGMAWEAKDQFEKAMAEYQLCLSKMPETKTNLAHLLAVMGKRSEARRLLAEMDHAAPGQAFNAFDIACVYAALGDRRRAFEWLERAYNDRAVWALKVHPMLDPLRNDPRYAQLLKTSGLAD